MHATSHYQLGVVSCFYKFCSFCICKRQVRHSCWSLAIEVDESVKMQDPYKFMLDGGIQPLLLAFLPIDNVSSWLRDINSALMAVLSGDFSMKLSRGQLAILVSIFSDFVATFSNTFMYVLLLQCQGFRLVLRS